jgi:hydrogenase maturation protease
VLCLGNDLLADDGIGPAVARELRASLPGLEVVETAESGLYLLDLIRDTDQLVVVDAVLSGTTAVGTVYRLEQTELRAAPAGSAHYAGLLDTLALGRRMGLCMPEEVIVLAVEVADLTTVGGPITPAVRHSLPRIVSLIQELTQSLRERSSHGTERHLDCH